VKALTFATTEKTASSMSPISKRPSSMPATPPAKRISIFGGSLASLNPTQSPDDRLGMPPGMQTPLHGALPPLKIVTPPGSGTMGEDDDEPSVTEASSSGHTQNGNMDLIPEPTIGMELQDEGGNSNFDDPKGKRPARNISRRK
jgi:hypothetical protein